MCKRFVSCWAPIVAAIGLIVSSVAPVVAQVTGPPNVFTAGTVISPDDVNLDFSTVYDNALNRFAGVMAGNLTFSPANTYDLTGVHDLGISRNATIGGTLGVTGNATFTTLATSGVLSPTSLAVTSGATIGGTLAVTGLVSLTSTAANALDVAGGIQAGSGNVSIVGTDGRIPALTATYFAAMDGSTITGIAEANITDGTILARVAANETISANGGWTFSGTSPQITFSNATSNWILWSGALAGAPTFTTRSVGTRLVLFPSIAGAAADFAIGVESGAAWYGVATTSNSHKWYGGTTLAATLTGTGDFSPVNQVLGATALGVAVPVYSFAGDTNTGLSYVGADAFAAIVGGSSVASFTTTGLTATTAFSVTNAISPAALASGNTNDYGPTGLSTTYTLRLATNIGGSTVTGLVAQSGGSVRQVCNLGPGSLTLTNEDALSTTTNRFVGNITLAAPGSSRNCATVWYDATSTRWRLN
jgi:hypothetical protein